jgi:hypothetical protein
MIIVDACQSFRSSKSMTGKVEVRPQALRPSSDDLRPQKGMF